MNGGGNMPSDVGGKTLQRYTFACACIHKLTPRVGVLVVVQYATYALVVLHSSTLDTRRRMASLCMFLYIRTFIIARTSRRQWRSQ